MQFKEIAKKFEETLLYFSSFDPTDQDGYKALGMEYNIYLFNKYRRDPTFLTDKVTIVEKQKNVIENIEMSKIRLASKFFIFYISKPVKPEELKIDNKETDGYFPIEEEQELFAAAKILKKIAPEAYLVVGSRQIGSIIPLQKISNVQTVYGKLYNDEDPSLKIISIYQASYIIKKKLRKYNKKIFMDFFGCIGYFPALRKLVGTDLLAKALKDTIIPVMGGVFPAIPQTLPSPNRNPLATMNQLYDKHATKVFMKFIIKHKIKLFYVTNNISKLTAFKNDRGMIESEKLGNSIYAQLATAWYASYLENNYVDFDVFAFATYCLYLVKPSDSEFENGFVFIDREDYSVQLINNSNDKENMLTKLKEDYGNLNKKISEDKKEEKNNLLEKYNNTQNTINNDNLKTYSNIIFVNSIPSWFDIVPTLLFTIFPKMQK